MTERLLLLVPPSLGKTAGGRRSSRRGVFDQVLASKRSEVLSALTSLIPVATPKDLATVFNATGPLLQRAIDSVEALDAGTAKLLPAWRRYTGVVWTHLDPATLEPAQRRHILIPSGLYGVVACDDPIADYRLKMNASVKPLGPLARFWRPIVTSMIEQRSKNRTIVNLLPKEHEASIDFGSLEATRNVVHARFVDANESRAIGHDAKAIKGMVARTLLVDGCAGLERLRWGGWNATRDGNEILVSFDADNS